MSAYPLAALRRLRQQQEERAHAATAAGLREWTAAEAERRRRQDLLAGLAQRVAAEELPPSVLQVRLLAAMGAHRSRNHALLAAAREALAEAAASAGEARCRLDAARARALAAASAREAVDAHRAAWERARQRAREAFEEGEHDDLQASRWAMRR